MKVMESSEDHKKANLLQYVANGWKPPPYFHLLSGMLIPLTGGWKTNTGSGRRDSFKDIVHQEMKQRIRGIIGSSRGTSRG
jgi:hypothetical protein